MILGILKAARVSKKCCGRENGRTRRIRSLSLGSKSGHKFFCYLVSALLLGWPKPTVGQELQPSPDRLVSQVVANELEAADAPGYCTYRIHDESSHGSTTREVIETREWLIGRLIRRNGEPLTADQQQKEDRRLTRLLTDSGALQKERAKQQTDERRVRAIFKSLPQAFHYEYVDDENDGDSPRILVEFRPNPTFDPTERLLRVLRGMQGTMLVDAAANRIVQVRARLVKRVNFAWGILGYLDPGGTFLMERENVGDGRWQITRIAMHFTGRVLLFKRLNISSVRSTSGFRCALDNLTLSQGLELLKNGENNR